MATLRDLFVRIGVKADDKQLKQFESGLSKMKGVALAAAAAAAAAGAALFSLANSVAKAGDNARKTSAGLGVTTEALQELRYAADLSGLSSTEIDSSIRKLSKTARDASLGMATYKRAFDRLGVSVKGGDGKLKNTDALLEDLADKFSKMENGTEKTALTMEFFGRSGAKMIPFLNAGAKGIAEMRKEAVALGIVMSDEDAAASEQFIDGMARFNAVLTSIKFAIGKEIIPTITEALGLFKDWYLQNQAIIKSNLIVFFKALVRYVKVFWGTLKFLGSIVSKVVESLGGFEKALKAIILTVGILMGFKAIGALGAMFLAIPALIGRAVAALSLLNFAMIKTKMIAFAIPIMIGIALAAIALIAEDIYTYFTGGDSITGRLAASFPVFQKFMDLLKAVGKIVAGVVNLIINRDFGLIKEGIVDLGNSILAFFGTTGERIAEFWTNALTKLMEWMSSVADTVVNYWTEKINSLINPISKIAKLAGFNFAGGNSVPQSAVNKSSSVSNQSSVNVSSPININVPEGTDTKAVGGYVKKAMDEFYGTQLFQAKLATESGEIE